MKKSPLACALALSLLISSNALFAASVTTLPSRRLPVLEQLHSHQAVKQMNDIRQEHVRLSNREFRNKLREMAAGWSYRSSIFGMMGGMDLSSGGKNPLLWGSNELHSRFHPKLEKLAPGGVFLGVGPEQNYSLAAKSRSDSAIFFDRNPSTVIFHLYMRSVLRSGAMTSVPKLASLKSSHGIQLFEKDIGDHTLSSYLKLNAGKLEELTDRIASELTEADLRHLNELASRDAIEVRLSSLDARFLDEISQELRGRGEQLKAAYVSNALEAEYTPKVTRSLIEAIRALPMREDGVLLSTCARAPSNRKSVAGAWIPSKPKRAT